MKRLLFLGFIFIASALVMFIEIIGAKLLAPVLGGSSVVWISQILVTLLSLAFGAYFSSLIPLHKQKFLGWGLLLSAFYFLGVLLGLSAIVKLFNQFDLVLASLGLSVTLYFLPLTALGMTFPFLTGTLNREYNLHLGTISFISTLGSALGTVLTYFSVLWAGNTQLLLAAAVIFWLYSWAFLKLQGNPKTLGSALGGILLLAFIGYGTQSSTNSSNKTLFFSNSHFGEVSVVKKGSETLILNDHLVQNGFDEKKQSSQLFTYALSVLPRSIVEIKSALVLGLGVGLVAQDLVSRKVSVEAVEINPVMVEVAQKFLEIDLKKVPTYIGDSREFVSRTQKQYDLVVLDCFLVDSVPKYLLTKEAFKDIGKILTPSGIVSINSFGVVNPNDYLTDSVYQTLKDVFPYVRAYSLNQWNVFYLASFKPLDLKSLDLSSVPLKFQEDLQKLVQNEIVSFSEVPILEDNWSAIELRDNSPRQLYRAQHTLKVE